MALFAELDSNNKVLRVIVACDQDVADNGGDASASAATHFQNTASLSDNGAKWMQTSENGSFRKQMAGTGYTYDEANDRFIIAEAPYPSWTMNVDGDWICPIPHPTIFQDSSNEVLIIDWDEDNQKWIAFSYDADTLTKLNWDWNPSSLAWDSI